ncbi:MAG: hypothetical protein H6841_00085 [Planctomycetes bacterium]|nr:hypothetical protein [Planctomycetota bacterium]
MRNRKKGNGLIVLILAGLLAIAVVGGVLMVQDGGKQAQKPAKPTVQVSR